MRKILSLVLAVFLISSVSFGQFSSIKKTTREKKIVSASVQTIQTSNKSMNAIIWSDDFSNAANWAISDNGANGSWAIASTLGTTLIGYGIPEFASTSGPDFAVFDSDGAGNGANNTDLVTVNPIDCSAETYVTLKFESYAAEYQSSVFTVLVSTDGTNFTQVAELYPTLPQDNLTANPEFESIDITSVAAGQATVYIKFNFQGDYDYFWAIDDVSIESGAPVTDGSVSAVTAPSNAVNCDISATTNVAVDIFNVGNQDLTGFNVNYRVNGGTVVTETYAGTIVGGATANYTFTAAEDFTALGHYNIEAWTTVAGDADNSNDTTSTWVTNGDATITFHITPDQYTSEVYYALLNGAGDVVYLSGPATGNDDGLADGVETVIDLCATSTDCYTAVIGDTYGDGGTTFSVDYNGVQAGSIGATDYTDQASIFAVGAGCPADDIAITAITNPSTVGLGNVDIAGTVLNLGADPLTSFDVTYTIDGGAPSAVFTATCNITSGQSFDFTHNVPWNNSLGTHTVEVTVSNPNGNTDPNSGDNVMSKDILVINEVFPKVVVYEEGTGTWCGWCVRGLVGLNTMAVNHADGTWIGIGVHNADPMTVTAYDAALGGYIGGYPSGIMNRHSTEVDPGLPTLEPAYQQHLAIAPEAKIEITGQTWNTTTRDFTVEITTTFGVDLASANYNTALIVLENGVTGTASAWDQTNYYSGGTYGDMIDVDGYNYATGPDPRPAAEMVYNHVGRQLVDGWAGTSTIPASVVYNTGYTHTYSGNIPADNNENQTSYVAIIINNADGTIVNATEVDLDITSGIAKVNTNSNFNIYPNPTTGLVKVEGVEGAQVIVYNMLGAVVYNEANASATTTIDLSSFNAGNYIVKVINNNEVSTQKIVLTK